MNMQQSVRLSYKERRAIRKRKWLGRFMGIATSKGNSWISYISVVITSFLFSLFYLQSFFYLITILLLCTPVISYNLTKYVFKNLKPSLSFDPPACIKGGQSMLNVSVNNPTRLPVSCIEISMNTFSVFYGGEDTVTHSLQLKSGAVNRLTFPVSFEKCGIYTAKAEEITVYDFMHLFSFKKKTDIEASVSIMPVSPPSGKMEEAVFEEGFDEFTDNERRGNASSNVTDIREYRPGDRLSRIHWKLTEKLDKLIVKENEAISSNEFTVLLELYQPSKEVCDEAYAASGFRDDSLYHVLDRAIEEAWSVSMELLNYSEPFRFMFYHESSQDFTSSLIRSKDELTEIMTQAFYAGSYSTADLALSVYESAGLNKGTLIHVK